MHISEQRLLFLTHCSGELKEHFIVFEACEMGGIRRSRIYDGMTTRDEYSSKTEQHGYNLHWFKSETIFKDHGQSFSHEIPKLLSERASILLLPKGLWDCTNTHYTTPVKQTS